MTGPAGAGRIVVVDYHKGNISSVVRGLAEAGGTAAVSDVPDEIRAASGVVLPGVGSFGDAMGYLRESGEADAVLDAIGRGVPFLGICLGLQLLFERGNETDDGSWAEGLGVLPGSATRLESDRLKVPHVGWDQLHLTERGRSCPLFSAVPEGRQRLLHALLRPCGRRPRRGGGGPHALRAQLCLRRVARQRLWRAVPPGEVLRGGARHAPGLRGGGRRRGRRTPGRVGITLTV